MSDPARQKEKQRLKRKQKQVEMRRSKKMSPSRIFSNAAERGLPLECYCNIDWQEKGMLNILCLRQIPNGTHAMAVFLIDMWCFGLKDAWGNLQISRSEFLEKAYNPANEQIGLEPIDEAEARKLIAGSVRFANKNGFRLPPRWERWASLLGDIGNPAEADLTHFGLNGKIRFVGNINDLSKRMIVGTTAEFFARKDVEFVIDSSAPDMLDETEAAIDDDIRQTEANALDTIRQWLIANGHTPHPQLPDALNLFLESVLLSSGRGDDNDEDRPQRTMDVFTSTLSPEQGLGFNDAMKQISDFAMQYESGEAFANAMGFEREE